MNETPKEVITKNFALYNGDSCLILKQIPSNSLHYSIFSPPFSSLYTYSNSDHDLGNSSDDAQFYEHFRFIVSELYRILMPGRLLSFHCMDLPLSKERDGVIGLKDFRGDLIRLFEDYGFVLHSQVTIWKDPVTAMQRTKALGLLHKQIKKDSCMSRMGIPDYVVTMRKPGENPQPVSHTNESYPVSKWQKVASPIWDEYATPVWWDINQSDTLNGRLAREDSDERHICPLQLPVIERCLELWTNPGDVVLDPFNGIGSTGYQALKMGRKYVGVELKESYYNLSVKNLRQAEEEAQMETPSLFDALEEDHD